jgi:hypothetical protein
MILLNGTPCFWWYRDQLLCSGPDDEHVAKLVHIASALKARVVGDDGEVYESFGSRFWEKKKSSASTPNPPSSGCEVGFVETTLSKAAPLD